MKDDFDSRLDSFVDKDLDISMSIGKVNGDDRSVVSSVGGNVSDAIKSFSKSGPLNIGSHLLQTMPSGNRLVRELDVGVEDLTISFDDFKKQFQQVSEEGKRFTRYALPKARRFLPKKIYNRVSNFAQSGKAVEEQQKKKIAENELQDNLDRVLAGGKYGGGEKTIETLMESTKRDVTDKKKLAGFSDIRNQLLFRNKFLVTVQQGWMRKMLELKYRHLHVSKQLLAVTKANSIKTSVGLDAIIGNTALPDQLKFKDKKERITSSLYDTAFDAGMSKLSNVGSLMAKRFKENVTNNLGTYADGLGMLTDSMEMNDELNSLVPESRGTKFGAFAAKFGSKTIAKMIAPLLGEKSKYINRRSDDILDAFSSGGRGASMAMKSSNNPIAKMLLPFMDQTDSSVKVKNSILENGTAEASFDVMTRQSIVEIIPAWLAKIAKNTRDIYTGDDTELEQYDIVSRGIVGKSKAVSNFTDYVFGDKNTRSEGYGKAVGASLSAVKASKRVKKTFNLDKDIKRVIANAISLRIPFHAGFLRDAIQTDSDDDITNKTIIKLTDGVDNKIDTLKAIYNIITYANGKENFDVSRAINSGIYDEIRTTQVHEKLSNMIESRGYRNLLKDKITSGGNVSQGFMADNIQRVGDDNFNTNFEEGEDLYSRAVENNYNAKQSFKQLKKSSRDKLYSIRSKSRESLSKVPGFVRTERAVNKWAKTGRQKLDKIFGSKNIKKLSTIDKLKKKYRDMSSRASKVSKKDAEDLMYEMNKDPNTANVNLQQAKSIIQEKRLLAVEEELLEEKQLKIKEQASREEFEKEKEQHRIQKDSPDVPDINFFEDDFGMYKEFKSKMGGYDAKFRPYLMQSFNNIKIREQLEETHKMLFATLTKLPSWRKATYAARKKLYDVTLGLPIRFAKKTGEVLDKTLKLPITLTFNKLTTFMKDSWFKIKNSKKILEEKKEKLREAKTRLKEVGLYTRTATATEDTAASLKNMLKNGIPRKVKKLRKGSYEEELADEQTQAQKSATMNEISKLTRSVNIYEGIEKIKKIGLIGAITVAGFGMLKIYQDIKQAGGLVEYLLRKGKGPFVDHNGREWADKDTEKDLTNITDKYADEYKLDNNQKKKLKLLYKAGEFAEAQKLVDVYRENAIKKGDYQVKTKNKLGHFQKMAFNKDVSGLTKNEVSKAKAYLLDNDKTAYNNYLKTLEYKYKQNAESMNLLNRQVPKDRERDINERIKSLKNDYKLSDKEIKTYLNLVMANKATTAAKYIRSIRENNNTVAEDVQNSMFTKVWRIMRHKYEKDYHKYGANDEQRELLYELEQNRYFSEATWFLSDILEQSYVERKGSSSYSNYTFDSNKIKFTVGGKPVTAYGVLKKINNSKFAKASNSWIKEKLGHVGAAWKEMRVSNKAASLARKEAGASSSRFKLFLTKTKNAFKFIGKSLKPAGAAIKSFASKKSLELANKFKGWKFIDDLIRKLSKHGFSNMAKIVARRIGKTAVMKGLKIAGNFLIKFLGPILVVCGFIRSFTLSKKKSDEFNSRFSYNNPFNLLFNAGLVAIDPYETGIMIGQYIKALFALMKQGTQNILAEHKAKKFDKIILKQLKELLIAKDEDGNPVKLSPEAYQFLHKTLSDAVEAGTVDLSEQAAKELSEIPNKIFADAIAKSTVDSKPITNFNTGRYKAFPSKENSHYNSSQNAVNRNIPNLTSLAPGSVINPGSTPYFDIAEQSGPPKPDDIGKTMHEKTIEMINKSNTATVKQIEDSKRYQATRDNVYGPRLQQYQQQSEKFYKEQSTMIADRLDVVATVLSQIGFNTSNLPEMGDSIKNSVIEAGKNQAPIIVPQDNKPAPTLPVIDRRKSI